MFTFHFYEVSKMKVIEIDEKIAPTLDKAREMAIFVANNDDSLPVGSDVKSILLQFDDKTMRGDPIALI